MAKSQNEEHPAKANSPAIAPALPLIDDETLDTFLQEPAKVQRLPVPPAEYRREFQRMIVSAFLFEQAA